MPTDISPSLLGAHATHPHHWMIEPPDGARSVGRCRRCGIERSFANSSEVASWARDADPDAEVVQLRREIARWRTDFRLSDEAA